MRTITIKRRGCGKRKEHGIYLVSEPGDGVLPLWINIIPPIPYDGDHFRGCIYVDLDLILAGKPREEYLADESAENARKKVARKTDIDAFGMSYHKRLSFGICAEDGISALCDLRMLDVRVFGACIRRLGETLSGKAAAHIPAVWKNAQKNRFDLVLAKLWQITDDLTDKNKTSITLMNTIRTAMRSINARADAKEIR